MANPHANLTRQNLHEAKRAKEPARAASTANVTTSSPGATLDGVTLVSGDRILLKDQSTGSANGLYVWTGSSAALTRATDASASTDMLAGDQVYVREGTANGASRWTLTTSAAITLGTTTLTFSRMALSPLQSTSAAATASSGTITTAGVTLARVSPAGAVTGVILAVGTWPGQAVTVVNEAIAANSVTFAASGTSNVADGTSSVVAGLTARRFVWTGSLWYPCK